MAASASFCEICCAGDGDIKMPLTANPTFRMVCFNSIGDGEDTGERKKERVGRLSDKPYELKTGCWLPFGCRVA